MLKVQNAGFSSIEHPRHGICRPTVYGSLAAATSLKFNRYPWPPSDASTVS